MKYFAAGIEAQEQPDCTASISEAEFSWREAMTNPQSEAQEQPDRTMANWLCRNNDRSWQKLWTVKFFDIIY